MIKVSKTDKFYEYDELTKKAQIKATSDYNNKRKEGEPFMKNTRDYGVYARKLLKLYAEDGTVYNV